MFKRTTDEICLDRARAFAMYAIRQYESEMQQFHQGRYTLWTGDLPNVADEFSGMLGVKMINHEL